MNITMHKVVSSQIDSVGHDEPSNTLAVKFHDGNTWHYPGVTPATFHAMKDSKSVGSFFHKNIKSFPDRFPGTKQPVHKKHDAKAKA